MKRGRNQNQHRPAQLSLSVSENSRLKAYNLVLKVFTTSFNATPKLTKNPLNLLLSPSVA
ncbi:hypothetical protein J6590_007243 [Homalodisca vitripennis]|nr:hypothetical protein J6590_007243 [Homalodisca vitripennis]